MPGLSIGQFSSDARLYRGVKDRLAVVHNLAGRSRWWARGRIHESGPGDLQIKLAGDVYREVERDGPARFQVVLFDDDLVRGALDAAEIDRLGDPDTLQLDAGHPRAGALLALHAAVRALPGQSLEPGQPLRIEEAVAEALRSLVGMMSPAQPPRTPSRRAVERARELLHARVADGVRLDELARHAGMDKYHLCRAFRAAVGLPPHAYLTELRLARAQRLLAGGVAPSQVAARVGFYDQSQLTRHFRRATGMTPGQYARAARR